MGNRYTQITIEERCEIARLQTAGTSIRQIAASLDRAPSTIARELRRNSSPSTGYKPSYAQQQARSHRWVGSRLDRDSGLRVHLRRPLSERPKEANDRTTPGHWEGDLMLFGVHKQAVLTLHERHSRLLIAARPPSKHADPMVNIIGRILAPLPAPLRQTVTFDNGTEFARHHRLHAIGIQTFFCDTHSPWQKGGVENAIGRMRRTLPRKTDLAAVTNQRFAEIVQAYNNTPRKCLGFLTPAEVFRNQVLHFKRESTFRPPPE